MRNTIEFYFDFGSPNSYLAHTQLAKVASESGSDLEYRPVLLGAIHKATGNTSPALVPAKGRYMLMHDLPRFIKKYSVPFKMNPHFPINTLTLMRGCYVAQEMGCFAKYIDHIFSAMWVKGLNMGDPAVQAEVLALMEINPEAFFTATEQPSVKDQLKEDTSAAIAKGLFGAPTICVGEEMFFGQDRLDFLTEYLTDSSA